MFRCPICNKIKNKPMDLAKHVIESFDDEHEQWLKNQNLDLSKDFQPLADLLNSIAKIK